MKTLKLYFRYGCFQSLLKNIEKNEVGGLDSFTKGYQKYGIQVQQDNSIHCLEWAPNATALYLWGEFSKYIMGLLPDT